MAELTISQLARHAGLRPSAIRYYERIRILPAARRVSGQRRYGISAVHRLAVLRRAQEAGFTLDEIRRLFFGFGDGVPASHRWQEMAGTKVAELDRRIEHLRQMKDRIERLRSCCDCETLDQCGSALFRSASSR